MLRRFYQKSEVQPHVDGRPFSSSSVPAPQVVPYTPIASTVVRPNEFPLCGRRGRLARLLPAAPLFRRFVLRFRDGSYLHSYSDSGIRIVASLQRAKVFQTISGIEIAADILGAEVVPIVCRLDGSGIKQALFNPSLFARASTKKKARKKGGTHEEISLQASIEEKQRSERNEVNSNHGDAGNTNATERRRVESIEGNGAQLTRITRTGACQPKTLASPSVEGRKLFFEFVSLYLGVDVFGVQPGYKNIPDQYLFRGPENTTMAVTVDVMLLDHESALSIVHQKIAEKEKAFERGSL